MDHAKRQILPFLEKKRDKPEKKSDELLEGELPEGELIELNAEKPAEFFYFDLPDGLQIKLLTEPKEGVDQKQIDLLLIETIKIFQTDETSFSDLTRVFENMRAIYQEQGMDTERLSTEGILSWLKTYQLAAAVEEGVELDELAEAELAAHLANYEALAGQINSKDFSWLMQSLADATEKEQDTEPKKEEEFDDGGGSDDDEDSPANNNFNTAVEEVVEEVGIKQEEAVKLPNTEEIPVDKTILERVNEFFDDRPEILNLTSMHHLKPLKIGRRAHTDYELVIYTGKSETQPNDAVVIDDRYIVQFILRERFEDLRYQPIVKLENLPANTQAEVLDITA